jgi:hypothetical protein
MIRHIAAVTTLVVLSAAAPVPDPLLSRLIADARALAPSTMSFDRATSAVQTTASGRGDADRRTDHWSGKAWTLLSVDGKPPSVEATAKYAKQASGAIIPGYYRLGTFLAATTGKSADAQGRTVYHIDSMPKGSVNAGGDISDRLAGDATVDTGGGAPYVARLHIYSRTAFHVMLVAKIDNFDVVTDYARTADGKPVLVRSVGVLKGSQFGTDGTQRTETTITNVGPAQR